ncbi:MAG: hypothetical protein A2Z96_02115 [Spirochaetes bacterium GWB1_48_6]|nr:MAG: hypothetical protein A2Z96_02115 [Spirochaetes bacterium GWB1_48_6]
MNQGTFKTIKVILFVFASLVITVFLYTLVFRVDFGGSNNYTVEFDTIGTIMVGSPVRKAGVKIGTVTKLEINPENQRTVIVAFTLYPGLDMKVDDSLAITTGGILGDQFIDVFPGAPESPYVPEAHRFQGEKALDFRTLTSQGGLLLSRLNQTTKSINDFFEQNQSTMNKILINLEKVSENLAVMTGEGSALNRMIPNLEKELATMTVRTNRLLALLEEQIQASGPALAGSIGDVRILAADLKKMMAGLSSDKSAVALLQNPAFAKDLETSVKTLRTTLENMEKITSAFSSSLTP